MTDWTTRIPPGLTSPHGVDEVHTAWFVPTGWPGKGPAVSLLIPECEMQFCMLAPDGTPEVIINRPTVNKNVKNWVRSVCRIAKDLGASLTFACDTADQAERAAKMARKLLPNHERTALERMCEAKTRARSNLN